MGSQSPPKENLELPYLYETGSDKGVATYASEKMHTAQTSHKWDLNLQQEELDAIDQVMSTQDQEKAAEIKNSFSHDSQYDSVRAAVSNTDGGEVANTVRAWVLGMLFTTIGSGLNMFLSMR